MSYPPLPLSNFTPVNMNMNIMYPEPVRGDSIYPSTFTPSFSGAPTASHPFQSKSKNSHVRNGQPTPPPIDDNHLYLQHTDMYGVSSYHVGVMAPPQPLLQEQQQPPPPPPPTKAMPAYSPPADLPATSPTSATSGTRRRRKAEEMDDPEQQQDPKRRHFLERNRLAASKCRLKKKEQAKQLEESCSRAANKNKRLRAEVANLKNLKLGLRMALLSHNSCGDEAIKLHHSRVVKQISAKENGDQNDADQKEPVETSVQTSVQTSVEPSLEPSVETSVETPVSSNDQFLAGLPIVTEQGMICFNFDGNEGLLSSSDELAHPLEPLPLTRADSTSSLGDPTLLFNAGDAEFNDFFNADF
ncbi:hypothetical protein BDV59DRAFT_203709 [Aspergillus ambiguus]|uniref:bZIP transcription factor atfB n=1 Tax=Aspergillus ambiguus TaxID=176160 RepID=UPI003CCCCBDD